MTLTSILARSLHQTPLTKIRQVSAFLDETPNGTGIHLLITGQDGTEMRIPVADMERTLVLMSLSKRVQGMATDVRYLLTDLHSDLTNAGLALSPNGTWVGRAQIAA